MNVRLIWITPDAERIIAYCARVSNPANQDSENIERLLKYCIDHKHWSIFEMVNMCVEIETSRAIAEQIVTHKSFSFQRFSQRYATVQSFEPVRARRQDTKNRQNSFDDLPTETVQWFDRMIDAVQLLAKQVYDEALAKGIAKESARFVLPVSASTRLYMSGNIRSWIHYLQVRDDDGVQQEHREIAQRIKQIFVEQLPVISNSLGWRTQ